MADDLDQLARLRAVIDAGQPLSDDLAEWVLLRLAGLPARDEAIAHFVRRQMRGPSVWSRCRRFAELAEMGDPIVSRLTAGAVLSPRHVYRIVTGK